MHACTGDLEELDHVWLDSGVVVAKLTWWGQGLVNFIVRSELSLVVENQPCLGQ